MFKLIAAIGLALMLAACSTVETSGLSSSATQNLAQERVQLRVRTGNEQMDRLVYEMVYQQFSDVIPLREAEPFTGFFEVTFASSSGGGYVGTSSTIASGNAYGTGWYTGGAGVSSATFNGTSTTMSSGTFLEWQNSTMLAVLKKADGERLWSADYSYKGGWEMSGWVVNTPDEAARLVSKRLKIRFIADRDGKQAK